MGLQNFPHLPRDNKDVAEKRSKLGDTLPPPFKGIFINFNKFATGSTCIDKIEMFMKGFLGYQVEDQHQHDIQEYMVNNLEDYERTVQETLSKGIF